MNARFLKEAAALVVLSVLCALAANVVASRSRKLAVVGEYPNALKVPAKAAEPPAAAAPLAETAEVAPAFTPVSPEGAPVSATATAKPAPTSAPAASAAPRTAVASAAPAPAKAFPPHPDKPWIEIDSDDVHTLYRQKAPFLDARRTDVFAAGHIAGARSIPVWESDVAERVKAFAEEGHDQRSPVVVYCSGGNCEDSHMLSEKLFQIGFDNVLIYRDGFPDWQKKGRPVETGAPR